QDGDALHGSHSGPACRASHPIIRRWKAEPRHTIRTRAIRRRGRNWPPPGACAMANLDQDDKILVGKSKKPEYLTLRLANRHGLVTGATGTGKTVTLQVLAEGFSRAGVPVFAADIKGDLSGIAAPGEPKDALVKRAKDLGIDYEP